MILANGTDWRMDPEKKAEWVAALRSEEYEQGNSYLCYLGANEEVKYCCLGVYGEKNNLLHKKFDGGGIHRLHRQAKGRLRDWKGFGVEMDDPNSIKRAYLPLTVIPKEVQTNLADLNDTGKTFAMIATWIEENL